MPPDIPAEIRSIFRPATSWDIHSWSFGAVKRTRVPNPTSWQQTHGTLDDQAIFGTLRDYACTCGKYAEASQANMICDICGVKVAPSAVRRSRFGHVDLSIEIAHALGGQKDRLDALPVLPAAFIESQSGRSLADAYENVLLANSTGQPDAIRLAVQQIFEILVPLFVIAHDWQLSDVIVLGRGLALVLKGSDGERCDHCGYLLTGLDASHCPGCGKRSCE